MGEARGRRSRAACTPVAGSHPSLPGNDPQGPREGPDPHPQPSYLLEFVDLPDEKVPVAPGNLGVSDVDHVLWRGQQSEAPQDRGEEASRTHQLPRGDSLALALRSAHCACGLRYPRGETVLPALPAAGQPQKDPHALAPPTGRCQALSKTPHGLFCLFLGVHTRAPTLMPAGLWTWASTFPADPSLPAHMCCCPGPSKRGPATAVRAEATEDTGAGAPTREAES